MNYLSEIRETIYFKKDRKEEANGIENHFRTEQLCPA